MHACRMFISFAAFGMLPIIGFVCAGALVPGLSPTQLFYIACVITAINLFGLGAFKARFHDKQYVRSGLETLLLGSACAAVAFYIGRWVAQFAGETELFAQPTMLEVTP